MEPFELTLETLKEEVNGDIGNAIKFVDSFRKPRLKKPTEPRLFNNKPTLDELKKYQDDLELFEKDYPIWKNEIQLIDEHNQSLDNLLVDFIKDESGLNDIPKQYQDKVYNLAYQNGHSGGHHEVYCKLLDLVELFN